MRRNVQIVLLCEDGQHEAFARRFLKEMGWKNRQLRVEKAPQGGGSGEQYVREHFPAKLANCRKQAVRRGLIALIDGENKGVAGRLAELKKACEERDIEFRRDDERILVLVPTWQLETWFAYLDGEVVDESKPDYPRLRRPRDCQSHVDVLAEMCRGSQLRQPAPSSLVAACQEYDRLRT